MLPGYDARVLDEAYKTLTVLGWSNYSEGAAPFDFIAERTTKQLRALKEEPTGDEKKWGALLDAYDFLYFSEFDTILRDGVQRGYFDIDRLKAEAEKLGTSYKAQELRSEYSKAWRLYHNSFAHNDAELVQSMYDSFKAGFRQLSPQNTNSTVTLFRELGHDAKADELIKLYVENVESDEVFDKSRWFSDKDVTDPAFLEAIDARPAKVVDKREPLEVLSHIAETQSWNREDVKRLSELTSADYYKMFKAINDEKLSGIVRMALSFDHGESEKKIATAVRDALVKIGQESSLNKRRVGKFGIKV